MTEKLHLTAAERQSSLWQKLAEQLEIKLAGYRAKVENPMLSEADRLALCWRIREIKEFLALGEAPAPKREMDAG